MNHELKENFLNFVQAVEKEAMLSTMNEIDTMLSKKQRFYRNLLYSDEAINIYLNMSDKNFLEVRRLRTNLQTKERLLEEIGGMIYEMKYNEITNKNH